MNEYTCYVQGCTGAYFGTCDLCEAEGCNDHIAITSKLKVDEEAPFSYLCHPCMDKQRKAYEKRWGLEPDADPIEPIEPTPEVIAALHHIYADATRMAGGIPDGTKITEYRRAGEQAPSLHEQYIKHYPTWIPKQGSEQ